jgi:pimeloyl-ACP methyl ester carboxylesterase
MDGMPSSVFGQPDLPDPQFVMSPEGHRIATYSWGDDADPTVLCVHGFASSCLDNWVYTGWVRDLLRSGFRVLGVDQRGHGQSDKPHDPGDYTMAALVGDLLIALETYLLDTVSYVGYSLGGRVGWQLLVDAPDRVTRGVLGGIPDGRPLARVKIEQARDYAEHGTPIEDPVTQAYVTLAERVPGNDLRVLAGLAEGMRTADADPDPARPPQQPVLFATGSEDSILEPSRRLASSAPRGEFLEIPGRHHFNAPGSRVFRETAIGYLADS